MQLATTDRPRLTPVLLSRRSCCGALGLTEQMPAALQGRMDAAQYAALSQRVNVALGPASRSRLSALGTFLGMVAVFLIILAGQQLHLTRDHYFGLLALSLLLWCSTFLLVVIYLLYLRRVATTLAEVGYDHQRLGFNLRMMWWPWAVYADLHPVVPDHQSLQEVVAHQPYPVFVTAPSHVMTAGMPQPMAPPMYYFVPQQLTQLEPTLQE